MKPGPRALYIEVKRRYNGSNNGELFLSHRDAARAIGVSKNTVGPYFDELQERGFIHQVQAGYLGPDGVGKAAIWALDELPTADRKPALKRFLVWKMQKPVPKTGSRRTKSRCSSPFSGGLSADDVPKTGTRTH
jgi:DNA-binding transcriptional MocR family regulator